MVSFDQFRLDPPQFGGGERREQVPGEVKSLFDRTSLPTLADEAVFEVVDEGQDATVVVGERLFSHDRDEAAEFLPTAQKCGDLVGDGPVVLAGTTCADAGVHEAAERGQDIDRW